MLLLDTNVLSELMRKAPDASVVAWLMKWPPSSLFTTTITYAELMYGIRCLPEGRRRDQLNAAARELLDIDFSGRVLAFDTDAAESYASVTSERRRIGRPVSTADAMIAAIALSRGATLATRNVRDFADCSLDLVSPWDASH